MLSSPTCSPALSVPSCGAQHYGDARLGDGTFQTPFEIEVGTGMSRIAVSDFNSDGIKDLGIAGDQAQVYVLLGIGNGSFLEKSTSIYSPPVLWALMAPTSTSPISTAIRFRTW